MNLVLKVRVIIQADSLKLPFWKDLVSRLCMPFCFGAQTLTSKLSVVLRRTIEWISTEFYVIGLPELLLFSVEILIINVCIIVCRLALKELIL